MNLEKQYLVLGLFHSKRIKCDGVTAKIYSCINSRVKELKPHLNKTTGYFQVSLDIGYNRTITLTVHQLIYLWYYGAFDPEFQIDHADRIKTNNTARNLKCKSVKKNIENSDQTHRKESKHQRPRKTEQEKQDMVERFKSGESFNAISKVHECSRYNVSVIIRNRLGIVNPFEFKKKGVFSKFA